MNLKHSRLVHALTRHLRGEHIVIVLCCKFQLPLSGIAVKTRHLRIVRRAALAERWRIDLRYRKWLLPDQYKAADVAGCGALDIRQPRCQVAIGCRGNGLAQIKNKPAVARSLERDQQGRLPSAALTPGHINTHGCNPLDRQPQPDIDFRRRKVLGAGFGIRAGQRPPAEAQMAIIAGVGRIRFDRARAAMPEGKAPKS